MSFDPIAYINEPRWLESRLGLERIAELLDRLVTLALEEHNG